MISVLILYFLFSAIINSALKQQSDDTVGDAADADHELILS